MGRYLIVTSKFRIKEEFLKILEKGKEYHYAIMEVLGFDETLKRIVKNWNSNETIRASCLNIQKGMFILYILLRIELCSVSIYFQ